MESSRGEAPDPSQASDLDEFAERLSTLRAWAGNPSYRLLAKRAGPLLRPPRVLSHATLANAFLPGRRRLDLDLVVAAVRALGLAESEVDRWRQVCVRLHAQVKAGGPAGVFRQLPADLATFTGRRAELAALLAAADLVPERARTVVVSAIGGMAGVGKTQLAVHAAHELVRAGRFTDAQLYVNLRGFDAELAPADPGAVLDSFLRALEVPAQKVPAALDERASMFRDRMAGRQALILLDNAADEKQVRDLIPAAPGCLVLITSRRDLGGLDGADVHRLDVFSADEAMALLRRILGGRRVDAEPEAAETLVGRCGRLPLAVAVIAAHARSRPAWSLAELADRLAARGLDAVSAGGRGVRPVFDLSYQGLPSGTRRLFRLLGAHPGADFTVGAAAALAGADRNQAAAILDRLVDEHLLEHRARRRFEFHDLLGAYAAERLAEDEPEADRQAATDRMSAWYLNTADAAARTVRPQRVHSLAEPAPRGPLCDTFPDRPAAQDWLDDEHPNLLAVQRFAAERGRHEFAARIPRTLWESFYGLCRWTEWADACALAAESARQLGDLGLQIVNRLDQGIALTEAGRPDEAERALTSALALSDTLQDPRGKASASLNLAALYLKIQSYDSAETMLEQALALHRSEHNRYGESSAVAGLAELAAARGDLQAAARHYAAALELQREVGDVYTEGVTLAEFGLVLVRLGRSAEAAQALRAGIALNKTISHGRGQAMCWEHLARALRDLGDREGAVAALEEARTLFAPVDADAVRRVEQELERFGGGDPGGSAG